jgi:hypothetical protein
MGHDLVSMRTALLVTGALGVGLLLGGVPLRALVPLLFIVPCAVMMIMMMRGMGGHGGQDDTDQQANASQRPPERGGKPRD